MEQDMFLRMKTDMLYCIIDMEDIMRFLIREQRIGGDYREANEWFAFTRSKVNAWEDYLTTPYT